MHIDLPLNLNAILTIVQDLRKVNLVQNACKGKKTGPWKWP